MSTQISSLDKRPEALHLLEPDKVNLEGLLITNFHDKEGFFERFAALAIQNKIGGKKTPAVSLTYNVYSANLAHSNPAYKAILQNANILRCDGIGALIGSRIVRHPIHTRLTNADYFPEMLEYLAQQNLSVFLIGGKPGVPEAALQQLETMVKQHSVVGVHHGYIHSDKALNDEAIAAINAVKPDVVVVGMGMPIQEFWINAHKNQIDTKIFFAVGAMIDYFGGAQYRCPKVFQTLGLEWLTRLVRYPQRMFSRYVIGNPYYLFRIFKQAVLG